MDPYAYCTFPHAYCRLVKNVENRWLREGHIDKIIASIGTLIKPLHCSLCLLDLRPSRILNLKDEKKKHYNLNFITLNMQR